MPLENVVWTCLVWLFISSAGSLGCVRQCNQTRFVIANLTNEIVLPGCKQCTSCSLKNQEIVQAWWHYCYHNGTCIPYQNGYASGFRNYSINVTRWWGGSGDYYITANYKYLCKNRPEHHNGWVVRDIGIRLRVLDVDINCTDETPVQEGMTVNLQCSAGLPHTLDLKEEFYFNNENWTCDPISNLHERSSKRKHAYRNQDQNYNCELIISNAQTSDSGSYECSVFVPGYDSPVMSRVLHLQVQSASLSTSKIIASALGAVLLAVILVIAVIIAAGVYTVYKRKRVHDGDPAERRHLLDNNPDDHPPQPRDHLPQPCDHPPQPCDQPPQPQGPHGQPPQTQGPHGQPPQPQGPHGQPPQPQGPRGQQPQPQGPHGQQPQPQGPHGQQPQILHLSGDQQPHGVDVSGGNSGVITSGSNREIFFSTRSTLS